jgi:hypothetical protein
MIYRWSRRYAALLRTFTTLAEVDAGSGPTSS